MAKALWRPEDAVAEMIAGFGSKFPDNFSELIASAAIDAKRRDIIPRIRGLVGDYVDLEDRRYAQLMKLIERELRR